MKRTIAAALTAILLLAALCACAPQKSEFNPEETKYRLYTLNGGTPFSPDEESGDELSLYQQQRLFEAVAGFKLCSEYERGLPLPSEALGIHVENHLAPDEYYVVFLHEGIAYIMEGRSENATPMDLDEYNAIAAIAEAQAE